MAAAIIGTAGLSLIKEHEGLRTKTYLDPVGIPTVCYGHTGPEVRMGQIYTVAQCETILRKDIEKHQAVIRPGHRSNCIGSRPLTQNQNDAVLSFTFNVGNGAFCSSTLARRLRAGDNTGASNEFPKWVNGRVRGKLTPLPGLVKRRRDERVLFLTTDARPAADTPSDRLRALLR